ncbi:nucleotidyltransferase domain-containing protein [Microbacterium sp.]|uniref:nucleotidyltransferase domain-containing protein n=1 Tax=Microbacterium sp. TaxID=51671 RepID=UPI003736D11E
MDLTHPISSVVPSAHGAVLQVLAHTTEPLSGRRVAELAAERVSRRRVNDVLAELANAGVVLRERRPPAHLYRLNREHVAAPGVIALAGMWTELMVRIREELASWDPPALAACLFGSAARGDATTASDIDILVVRGEVADDDPRWHQQIDRLIGRVHAWSGNGCEVLDLDVEGLAAAEAREDRLVLDLRRDAITLVGPDIRSLLPAKVAG